jgi:hypothetical protein
MYDIAIHQLFEQRRSTIMHDSTRRMQAASGCTHFCRLLKIISNMVDDSEASAARLKAQNSLRRLKARPGRTGATILPNALDTLDRFGLDRFGRTGKALSVVRAKIAHSLHHRHLALIVIPEPIAMQALSVRRYKAARKWRRLRMPP